MLIIGMLMKKIKTLLLQLQLIIQGEFDCFQTIIFILENNFAFALPTAVRLRVKEKKKN